MTISDEKVAVGVSSPTEPSTDTGAPFKVSSQARERLKVMFEAHYDLVWRLLRRNGLSPESADDGAQQVFMVAARRLSDIEHGSERAFLCAAAIKLAPRLRQGVAKEVATDELPETSGGASPEHALELKRRRALLDRILSEMDEDLRIALVLTEIEGFTKREVAEALGIPEGTAASRLRRAREDFQERLSRYQAKGGA